jgi:hypothetical protein
MVRPLAHFIGYHAVLLLGIDGRAASRQNPLQENHAFKEVRLYTLAECNPRKCQYAVLHCIIAVLSCFAPV